MSVKQNFLKMDLISDIMASLLNPCLASSSVSSFVLLSTCLNKTCIECMSISNLSYDVPRPPRITTLLFTHYNCIFMEFCAIFSTKMQWKTLCFHFSVIYAAHFPQKKSYKNQLQKSFSHERTN